MLKLLTCARGHFWESPDEPTPERAIPCPECGAPADTLPLLDLAPAETPLPPPVVPLALELFNEAGTPNVAGFEITEDLGRSVTGVRLYRARQHVINRDVLLEVVVAREDVSQHAWGSLRGQASALGKLSHPNIVQIHDVGERDRQLFYNATELVDGPTLAQKVADKPLPFPQVVRLMEMLARAVDHAHAKGVLHRNLRPACVLLQPVAVARDSPARDDPAGPICLLHSGFFIPKLVGFGLARRPVEGDAIDSELFGPDTGYLSPEQAWGRSKDLGPHTDVYGLGGILYFLLTGRPPFRGPALSDIIDAIQTADLVPPSALRRVPADLEAICRRCLTRHPRRRYASAGELADDLARVARNLPIKGSPVGGAARLGRFVRRRPAVTTFVVLALASFLASVIAYAAGSKQVGDVKEQLDKADYYLRTARNEVTLLQTQKRQLEQLKELVGYRATLDSVRLELDRKQPVEARALLERCREADRGFEWHYLMARTNSTGEAELSTFSADVVALAVGPGGKYLATAEKGQPAFFGGPPKGIVRLWHVPLRRESFSWTDLPGPVHALAFSPDGLRLAVAGGNSGDSAGELRVYSLEEGPTRGSLVTSRSIFNNRLTDVAYTRDGSQIILAGGNGQLYAVYSANGQFARNEFGQPVWAASPFTHVAVAPDGTIASTTEGGEPRLYRANASMPMQMQGVPPGVPGMPGMPPGIGNKVQALALGPNGLLAVARSDRTIRIQSLEQYGTMPEDLTGLPQAARLVFSADGKRLAALFDDGSVRVWGLAGASAVPLLELSGPGKVGLAFTASGRALIAAGPRKVVIWGTVED